MSRRTVIGEAIITAQQPSGNFTPLAASATTLATGVLTSDNTNVSIGDTVTIGPNTYIFVSLITSFGQVLRGATADASLTALAQRINAADTPFNVVTSSVVSAHALTLTAIDDGSGGASGNQIVTTTTAAHLSWGAATLTGGAAGALAITGPSGGIPTAQPVGAANEANSQATSTGTAATLVVARPTRTGCAIKNTDSANSVWIGKATVTTSNGYLLGPSDSVTVTWVGLIQIIDNGSHAVVTVWDEYA